MRIRNRRSTTVRFAVIVAFAAATIPRASAQATSQELRHPGTPEDEAAIRTIVDHWRQMWEEFDASYLKTDYAEDADWLNAFGVRLKGSANILEFMQNMMKRPNVRGRQTTWEEPRIRFVRSDVALAYRDYRTVGHRTLDGAEMPPRNTHAAWALTKDGGRWHIVSHVFYDDNSQR